MLICFRRSCWARASGRTTVDPWARPPATPPPPTTTTATTPSRLRTPRWAGGTIRPPRVAEITRDTPAERGHVAAATPRTVCHVDHTCPNKLPPPTPWDTPPSTGVEATEATARGQPLDQTILHPTTTSCPARGNTLVRSSEFMLTTTNSLETSDRYFSFAIRVTFSKQ